MTMHATPTITTRYDGGVDLRFPYCAELIADLKASIPPASRTYDPDSKTWSVSLGWAPTARRLMARHFPDVGYTSSPPPSRPAPPRGLDAAYQALYVRPEAPACVVEAAYRALSRLYHPDRKPPAERDRIAEQAGVSTSTAATAIKTLEQGLVIPGPDDAEPTPIRLFERKVRWQPDTLNRATGEIRDVKQTFYSRPAGRLPTDLRVLATATKVKPRAHGGKRITCPDHPNADIVVKWSRHCAECDRLLEHGQRTEAAPSGVNEQDADLLVAVDPTTTPSSGPGVNQQDALLVQYPLPSEYVLRSPNLGSSHNDEPAWLAEAPPVEEEPVASVVEAWLAGAALPPRSRLQEARIPLTAADHAADREELRRANADLTAYLEPLARARGRSSVPKPGAEAGDDPWTW